MPPSVDEAFDFLQKNRLHTPSVAIVLGSGLSAIGDSFDGESYSYAQIPGMPRSTVSGHRGVLKIGPRAMVFLGRFHHYEGYPFSTVAFPVFLMKKLGVKTVVLTNAAGGLRTTYTPGQLVLIRDHINLMGSNPFVGPHNPEFGSRFFDMTSTYTPALREVVKSIAERRFGSPLEEGVYAGLTGPSYETPAEIRFLQTIGADLVGMSTVPEAIAARSCGLKMVGISCVTNWAAGISPSELDHQEVLDNGKKAEASLRTILHDLVESIAP